MRGIQLTPKLCSVLLSSEQLLTAATKTMQTYVSVLAEDAVTLPGSHTKHKFASASAAEGSLTPVFA